MGHEHTKVRIITWLMTLQMLSRGLDYLFGNPKPGAGVFEVTTSTPATLWGVSCIVAATIIAAACVAGAIKWARNGAIIAMAIYLAFAVVIADDIARPPFDDWRFLTGYIFTAAIWGVIAWTLTMRKAVIDSREERQWTREIS